MRNHSFENTSYLLKLGQRDLFLGLVLPKIKDRKKQWECLGLGWLIWDRSG